MPGDSEERPVGTLERSSQEPVWGAVGKGWLLRRLAQRASATSFGRARRMGATEGQGRDPGGSDLGFYTSHSQGW